jgi:hypothetical protein
LLASLEGRSNDHQARTAFPPTDQTGRAGYATPNLADPEPAGETTETSNAGTGTSAAAATLSR